jgi:hypothetical protein
VTSARTLGIETIQNEMLSFNLNSRDNRTRGGGSPERESTPHITFFSWSSRMHQPPRVLGVLRATEGERLIECGARSLGTK